MNAPPTGQHRSTDPVFAERYRAMSSRDARFDGQFITGVHTTGIYCRPSCPAVDPKAGQRHVLPDRRGRPRGRAPRLQALPAGCGARLPGMERPRRPGRPRHATHRRRHRRTRRRAGTRPSPRLHAPTPRPRADQRARRRPARARPRPPGPDRPAPARRHRPLRSPMSPSRPGSPACGSSTRRWPTSTARRPARSGRRRKGDRTDRARAHPHAGQAASLTPAPARPGALRRRRPLLASSRLAPCRRPRPGTPRTYSRTLALPHGPAVVTLTLGGTDTARTSTARRTSPTSPTSPRSSRACDGCSTSTRTPVAIDEALADRPGTRRQRARRPRAGACPGSIDAEEILFRALIGQQVSVAGARTALARLTEALGTPDRRSAGSRGSSRPREQIAERRSRRAPGPDPACRHDPRDRRGAGRRAASSSTSASRARSSRRA